MISKQAEMLLMMACKTLKDEGKDAIAAIIALAVEADLIDNPSLMDAIFLMAGSPMKAFELLEGQERENKRILTVISLLTFAKNSLDGATPDADLQQGIKEIALEYMARHQEEVMK